MTRFVVVLTALALLAPIGAERILGQTAPAATTVLNANTASDTDLLKVPHVNAAISKALIARRPFANVTALDTFLTEQKLTRPQIGEVYGRLFVPVNLNTASDAEILLIPGMGQRMLREFKEYRPYKAMEQFRREIGKYVSTEEVARFERYVTIN